MNTGVYSFKLSGFLRAVALLLGLGAATLATNAQPVALPLTTDFGTTASYTTSTYFHTISGGTRTQGTTWACAGNGYTYYFTSTSGYMTTRTARVNAGKGVRVSFTLRNAGTFVSPDVYIRVGGDGTTFQTATPTNYGWAKLNVTLSSSTSSCVNNSFDIPNDIVGGQRFSIAIHYKNGSSNWVAIDNLSLTEINGTVTVPTTYTENFNSTAWYPTSSYVSMVYHSSNTTSTTANTYLYSGGVSTNYLAFNNSASGDLNPSGGPRAITKEFNTSAFTNGQLSFAFRSYYPCPPSAISWVNDEDYTSYAPEVYIMAGVDNAATQAWTQLPVKYYFPNGQWNYATVDISGYKNASVKLKFEPGLVNCSSTSAYHGVDNIKILDRNCAISSQTTGAISGVPASLVQNTNYSASVPVVSGANYYKWMIRDGNNTYYSGAPYITNQGTRTPTINFGTLAGPVRLMVIPYDTDPASNTDACYASISYTGTAYPCPSQLNGTYTIGASGDYTTFGAAVTDLINCGVSGPVVFNVAAGTYSEQITIPAINGTSSTNTVTFQSANGVRTGTTLTTASTRAALTLSTADHIIFKDMSITNTFSSASSNYFAVEFTGAASDITFDNCVLSKAVTTGTSNTFAVVYGSPGNNLLSNIVIKNSLIQNGGYGIYFNAPSSGSYRWTGVEIDNNTFSGQLSTPVSLTYLSAVKVTNNDITTGTSSASAAGIDIANCTGNHDISGNTITMNGTGTTHYGITIGGAGNHTVSTNTITMNGSGSGLHGIYFSSAAGSHTISGNVVEMAGSGTLAEGIYLSSSAGQHQIIKNNIYPSAGNITYGIYFTSSGSSAGSNGLIANNMLVTTGASSNNSHGGIYFFSSSAYFDIYFNSVLLAGTTNAANAAANQGAIYAANSTGTGVYNIRNNILVNNGTSTAALALNIAGSDDIATISNNNYYTPNNTNVVKYGSTTYNFAGWTETGKLNVDPAFVSGTAPYDLHTAEPALNAAAAPLAGIVDEDIDGDSRAGTPDIGADEFNTSTVVADFSASATNVCSGATVTFTDLTTNNPTTWAWVITPLGSGTATFVGGTTPSSQNPQVQFTGSGSFTVSLTATGANSDNETKAAYIGLSLSGTYTIGGTAPDYADFVTAVTDLTTIGVCGPVIFDVRTGTYNETFAITAIPGVSAVNTVTFQPEAGATVTLTNSVSGANAATVTLDGSDYVTFEGRQGGSGTAHSFTIINGSTSASAIQYLNDATNNRLQYCNVQGSFSGITGGLVEIGTSAGGSTGNSNITIDNNKIGNASALISGAIYAQGTSGVLNSNNSITNNEIFNLGNGISTTSTYGLRVTGTGNGGGWTITGNHIYNSSATTPSGGIYAIYFIPGSSANTNTISGNYIGGKAMSAGGSTLTMGANFLVGIYVNAGTGNTINNNVVQNASGSGDMIGIQLAGSTAGTINGNTIGHATNANSLVTTGGNSGYTALLYGIFANTSGSLTIDGNTIANISATSNSNNVLVISHFGTGGASTVTNNIIQNVLAGGSYSTQLARGIYVAVNNVSGNTIDNNEISNFGNDDNQSVITPVYGIWVGGSNAGGTIRKNKVTGIYQRQPGTLYGINLTGSGNYEVSNNVVETDNNGFTNATFIYGTWDGLSSGTLNYFYNTIVISGGTTDQSFGYLRNGSSTATLNNNILINAGTSPSGNHYAIYNANASGFTSNYNFLATAFPAKLGYWVSGVTSFAQWQSNGVDGQSTTATTISGSSSATQVNIAELFTDYANGDLSIGSNSNAQAFISNNGTPVSVTDDILSITRNSVSPDMGAYEFSPCTPPLITGNTPTGPTTCGGSDGTIVLTGLLANTTYAVDYDKDAAPQTTANITTNGSGNLTLSGLSAGSYNNIVVTLNGCSSDPAYPTSGVITLSDPAAPSVVLGTNPSVCSGSTTANLSYSGPTGSPNQYSITWDAGAAGAGFTAVNNASLTNPIVINVPGAAAANTYTGTLTVRNSATGCVSGNSPISVTTTTCTSGYTWNGPPNGDWNTAINWTPNGIPNGCAVNVIINAGGSPVISATDINVGNINIGSGATITLSGRNLNVCGKWTGGGATNAAVVGTGTTFINSTDSAQVISGNTQFDILQINNADGVSLLAGANVSINTGLHLQSGVFTVSAGTLRLLSTAANHNSYIDNFTSGFGGTLVGNIIANRYVPVAGFNQHFISSPLTNAPLSQLNASGTDGAYIVPTADCDETRSANSSPYGSVFTYVDGAASSGSCMLGNWRITSAGTMASGKGYSAYLTGNSIISLSGTANSGNTTVGNLNNSGYPTVSTKQGQPVESGWNLVGNPYPSAIDLTTGRTADGFGNQVQIWQTSGPFAGSWQPDVIDGVAGHAVIPPFQAFMVRRSGAGIGTYPFYQAERTRSTTTTFYRTLSQSALKLELSYNSVKDVTRVEFNADATIGFDQEFDANKYNGAPGRPTLYTTMNANTWYAINTLPLLKENVSVPMGLRPEASGTMSITATGIETFDATTYIYLEDKKTGTWHNLRTGAYTFTTSTTDVQSRFVLHFTPPAQILTADASCEASGTIAIEQPGNAAWNYVLQDANGIVVSTGLLNDINPLTVYVPVGIYQLQLADNSGYTVSRTIQVGGTQAVNAAFNSSAVTAQAEDVIEFTGTTAAAAYYWSFGDGTSATGKTVSHKYTAEGVYNVTLEVSNESGCVSTTAKTLTITQRSITGIDEAGSNKLKIWSHDNRVYVDFSKQDKVEAQVDIYNVLGQLVSSEKFGRSTTYSRELSNMEAGYVFIRVNNDNVITTKKVFIANIK